jgi:hypothetical protein
MTQKITIKKVTKSELVNYGALELERTGLLYRYQGGLYIR